MIKEDFSDSIRFITKERPDIMKMLLLTGKLTSGRRSYVLASIGVCIGLAGVVFLFPSGVPVRYADKMFSVGAAALTGQFLLRHVCPCMLQYPKKKEGAPTWETRRLHKEYSGI